MQTSSANLSLSHPRKQRSTRAEQWRRVTPLASGERGTLQTLRLMAQFVRRDAQDEELTRYARKLVGDLRGHDFAGEIRTVFEHVRNLRYQRDPVGVERVADAWRTLEAQAGDCDDKVTLLCSLLHCLGHQTRFAVSGAQPHRWTHVYCEVRTKDGWLALDPTPEAAAPGWETAAPYKAIFEIVPAISLNLRVVRHPKSSTSAQQTTPQSLSRRVAHQRAGAFSPDVRAYLAGETPCCCGRYIYELELEEPEGLGADTYEWKQTGPTKCELQKKKCGFWCKIGRGFKTVGKWALVVAPIALAPFTAGGSLALTGAAGAAVTVGAAASSAASAILTRRYSGNLPGDAQVQEPTGACLQILQNEAAEEARRVQEEEDAKRRASQESSERTTAAVQAQVNSQGGSAGFSFNNPILLAGLAIGGVLLLTRR